jgi:hypothetical protein
MFEIIIANFGFWFNLIIPIAIALYLAITHREYIWKEFAIQTGATFAYIFLVYSLLFATTADLMDTEFWNSYIKKFEYYQEWEEEVTYTETYECGTSKEPQTCTRTKTRIDYHSPYWQIITSNNERISISKKEYLNAVNEFGDVEKNLFRSNQVSYGDGNMFISEPNKIIPITTSHSYINYVVAAKQHVMKATVSQSDIDLLVKNGKLKTYPTQYDDKYGSHKLKRVIDTVGVANVNDLMNGLDLYAAEYGSKKQVNPIIYITDEDRIFKESLEHYWNKAKKNDTVLILGVDSNGNIKWSDVIAWTNNTDFIVDCGKEFEGESVKSNVNEIISRYTSLITNSYIRKPMKEFKYLTENITLEWYWQFLIFLGNVLVSFFLFRYMLNNYERKN